MDMESIPLLEDKKENKKKPGLSISERSKMYRMRKKVYLENLESKVEALEKENKMLKLEIADLKANSQKLETEVLLEPFNL